jgi:hypothetical protein
MGRYIIKEQVEISDKMYDEYICNEALLHYCQKITLENLHKHAFYLDIPLGNHITLKEKRSFSYWTELLESAKDRETEIKRLNLALYDLKGGGWETVIKKRIEELKAVSE